MNNTKISNTFNSDNSNIAYIRIHHSRIMTIIKSRINYFKPMIKKSIGTNHAFFAAITIESFTFLQLYKHCLNILARNICVRKHVKNH